MVDIFGVHVCTSYFDPPSLIFSPFLHFPPLPVPPSFLLPLSFPSPIPYPSLVHHASYPTCDGGGGCSLQNDGYSPLYVAADKGHTKVVQALLTSPSIDVNLADVSHSILTPSPVVVGKMDEGPLLVLPSPPHPCYDVLVPRKP